MRILPKNHMSCKVMCVNQSCIPREIYKLHGIQWDVAKVELVQRLEFPKTASFDCEHESNHKKVWQVHSAYPKKLETEMVEMV